MEGQQIPGDTKMCMVAVVATVVVVAVEEDFCNAMGDYVWELVVEIYCDLYVVPLSLLVESHQNQR